jgi:hypothetical protein
MGYFLYDRHDTRIVSKEYKTHAAAQSQLTRMGKGQLQTDPTHPIYCYGIAEKEYYFRHIERKVVRVNLMSGAEYEESVNTPLACSPASETYWSM